jgi:hypothetical protein
VAGGTCLSPDHSFPLQKLSSRSQHGAELPAAIIPTRQPQRGCRKFDLRGLGSNRTYGWPFAPLGTCEVIPFRANSRIRFDTASAPVSARPFKKTKEAPRSVDG